MGLDFVYFDDLCIVNAFLEKTHELILVVIVVIDHLALYSSEEEQNWNVDERYEYEDGYDVSFVRCHETNSSQ